MTTRLLTIADVAALRELAAIGDAEGFRFIQRFVDDLVAGRTQLNGRCEFFLGATVRDQLVGIGGVTPDPYLPDPDIGRVRHLYVRPDSRGVGIGRQLVEQLEARAQPCYRQLQLRTDTAAAARFYERLGYAPVESSTATHRRILQTDLHTPAT